MKNWIMKNVLEILRTDLDSRDNDWILAFAYCNIYFQWMTIVFIQCNIIPKIIRIRALLQAKYPELRWTNYKDRQRHAKVMKEVYRSQEKPEELKQFYKDWDKIEWVDTSDWNHIKFWVVENENWILRCYWKWHELTPKFKPTLFQRFTSLFR